MKKVAGLVLLSLIIFQSGGLFLSFMAGQYIVKYGMTQDLQRTDQVYQQLDLTVDEFQRAAIGSREIYFQGNLYDVKSTVRSGNSIKLHVLRDARETYIFRKLNTLARNTGAGPDGLSARVLKLLLQVYIVPARHRIPVPGTDQFVSYRPILKSTISWPVAILTPPPENS